VTRAIDTTGFVAATLADQPAPALMWIGLPDLVVDDRYQRAITAAGRRHIQRIADAWDWKRYNPILIAPTADGRFAIVDGQHRAHAAAVAGLESLPAMMVPMTPREQAIGFAAVNRDRIRLDTASIYRAELAAGTDWAIAARDAVDAAGCVLLTYNPSSTTRRAGDVTAVTLIRRMVEAGEAQAVTVGLAAIRQSAQGAAGSDAYQTNILKVWLPILATNQTYLRLPLADIFDDIEWASAMDAARARSRVSGQPSSQHLRDTVLAAIRDARAAA
jgi:hypothetical protein